MIKPNPQNKRILVIDDNQAIHEDFKKILEGTEGRRPAELGSMEAALFGPEASADASADASAKETPLQQQFQVDAAHQGREGLEMVQQALSAGHPYSMMFVDMRMPPGWDGIETIERIWKVDPEVQTIICTAFSDHSWSDIVDRLGEVDRLLVLKKPFDSVEVRQIACAFSSKWRAQQQVAAKMQDLDAAVRKRTSDLREANHRLRHEIEERRRVEVELRLAQKLEAVGQLAAGIAHEINTPIQYLGDNAQFLEEAFQDLVAVVQDCADLCSEQATGEAADRLVRALEDADWAFLRDRVPEAIKSSQQGIGAVANIVKAMKEFGHPDHSDRRMADINQGIRDTLTVTRSEYKYVARVEAEYGDLPLIACHPGELNQVFLNLIVNAAHAIKEVAEAAGQMGQISIRTEVDDGDAIVSITDTGQGIPPEIQPRIFDPFFTTKEVGKGTGQGLAIARSIVHDKHNGNLDFRSEPGKGTTFIVRLPVNGDTDPAAVNAED